MVNKRIFSSTKWAAIAVLLLVAAMGPASFAADRTTSQNGVWNDNATWGGNPFPTLTTDDHAIILHLVTVDAVSATADTTDPPDGTSNHNARVREVDASTPGRLTIVSTGNLTVQDVELQRSNTIFIVDGGILNARHLESLPDYDDGDILDIPILNTTINILNGATINLLNDLNLRSKGAALNVSGAATTINLGDGAGDILSIRENAIATVTGATVVVGEDIQLERHGATLILDGATVSARDLDSLNTYTQGEEVIDIMDTAIQIINGSKIDLGRDLLLRADNGLLTISGAATVVRIGLDNANDNDRLDINGPGAVGTITDATVQVDDDIRILKLGDTLNIGGNAAVTVGADVEVQGPGAVLNMSGGTLTAMQIHVNNGNATDNDVFNQTGGVVTCTGTAGDPVIPALRISDLDGGRYKLLGGTLNIGDQGFHAEHGRITIDANATINNTGPIWTNTHNNDMFFEFVIRGTNIETLEATDITLADTNGLPNDIVVVDFTNYTGGVGPGNNFTLFTYSGILSGSFANLQLINPPLDPAFGIDSTWLLDYSTAGRIDLIGADPVFVSDVIGLTSNTAIATLEALGLEVTTNTTQNLTVPEGYIAQMYPLPDTPVPPGTEVTVWISTGTGDYWEWKDAANLDFALQDNWTSIGEPLWQNAEQTTSALRVRVKDHTIVLSDTSGFAGGIMRGTHLRVSGGSTVEIAGGILDVASAGANRSYVGRADEEDISPGTLIVSGGQLLCEGINVGRTDDTSAGAGSAFGLMQITGTGDVFTSSSLNVGTNTGIGGLAYGILEIVGSHASLTVDNDLTVNSSSAVVFTADVDGFSTINITHDTATRIDNDFQAWNAGTSLYGAVKVVADEYRVGGREEWTLVSIVGGDTGTVDSDFLSAPILPSDEWTLERRPSDAGDNNRKLVLIYTPRAPAAAGHWILYD